jgi:holo-[acyl-carrier protein] synthase
MDRSVELRAIVAEFLEVDAASIGPHTELGGARLSSSLARAGLDAALRRRLQSQCPIVYTARGYRELEAAVLGLSESSAGQPDRTPVSAAPSTAPPNAQPLPGGFRCGVDVESVDHLPEADDYWEHDFYKTSFTAGEIAYCATQPNPREHFAARWAAKEAVKKLGPEYLQGELADFEVVRAADGAPQMRFRGGPLPIALSLAHAGAIAIAVAVCSPQRSDDQDRATAERTKLPPPVATPVGTDGRSRLLRWLESGLSVAALALAGWALARTFGIQ